MTQLRRSVGPVGLSLYGMGVTIGAGIYVLVGEMAGLAGDWTALAFLLASVLAGLTAGSYAELATRFPEAAGEAAYVRGGLHNPLLSATAAYGVTLTGIVSSATLLRGFSGYFREFLQIPDAVIILAMLAVLTLISIWGVRQTVWTTGAVTLLAVAGLIFVIFAAAPAAVARPLPDTPFRPEALLHASVLGFFAFIGFEDIVNLAEEVKRPARDLPVAIAATLVMTAVLYALVAWVATAQLPGEALSGSEAPLSRVVEAAIGTGGRVVASLAMFAIVIGVLVQLTMAARVLFGLARRRWAPGFFFQVHPATRTPHRATLLAALLIAVLALTAPLSVLAKATSLITLFVFTLINVALLAIKWRGEPEEGEIFQVPVLVPALGAAASLGVSVAALVFGAL